MACRRSIQDPWWFYCGETDMGQTAPVLCEECGGTFQLTETANMDKEKWIKQLEANNNDDDERIILSSNIPIVQYVTTNKDLIYLRGSFNIGQLEALVGYMKEKTQNG